MLLISPTVIVSIDYFKLCRTPHDILSPSSLQLLCVLEYTEDGNIRKFRSTFDLKITWNENTKAVDCRRHEARTNLWMPSDFFGLG